MNHKHTKIVATIGPTSASRQTLRRLIQAGVNVTRLNMSHGTHEEHAGVILTIRELSAELKRPVAILMDLQGPKIRTGWFKNHEPITLKTGETVTISTTARQGDNRVINTTYKNLAKDVVPQNRILMDDGLLALKVLSKDKTTVKCRVTAGGILKEHKGINLPGVNVSASSLTLKDKADLDFGITSGVDYFALSFVRKAEDLKTVKNYIARKGADIPLIAKIEKPEALKEIDGILKIADAIMVARGDLGVEMTVEHVPAIQKEIIEKAVRANRPVITATQMLETMTYTPVPTRAEVSDVANAIYDGTDAVMLSGETAAGKYPVKAVQMMSRIIREAERSGFLKYNRVYGSDPLDLLTHAIAQAAVDIREEIDARAIIAFSMSGRTTKQISKQRPSKPIYAFTPSLDKYNQLALLWGVTPFLIPPVSDPQKMILMAEKILLQSKRLKNDDRVVVVAGLALQSGSTNMIKIHRMGEVH